MIGRRRKEQSTEMDSLRKMRSDGERNLRRELNLRLNLEKKLEMKRNFLGEKEKRKKWKHS